MISVAPNVKYMLDWIPAGIFGMIIAITVGILIPLMLCLFGWLEKQIKEQYLLSDSNGRYETIVRFHLEKYPDM